MYSVSGVYSVRLYLCMCSTARNTLLCGDTLVVDIPTHMRVSAPDTPRTCIGMMRYGFSGRSTR